MNFNPFEHSQYRVEKQFFQLAGGTFRFFDSSNSLVLLADMKAFKLKEDIRVYPNEARSQEIMVIKARSIIDFSAAYDVWDSGNQEKIGALKRMGFQSMVQDEWQILDNLDQEIGRIKEDSIFLALARRFVPFASFIPQSFSGQVRGSSVLKFSQHFNPFLFKMNLDYTADTSHLLDRRLGIAAAILLCSIEGRQSEQ